MIGSFSLDDRRTHITLSVWIWWLFDVIKLNSEVCPWHVCNYRADWSLDRQRGGRQLSHLHLPTERAKNEVWLRGVSADHRHFGGRSNYVTFALQIEEVCHATEQRQSAWSSTVGTFSAHVPFFFVFFLNKYCDVLCAALIWFTAAGLLSGHEHNSDLAVMVCLLLVELM